MQMPRGADESRLLTFKAEGSPGTYLGGASVGAGLQALGKAPDNRSRGIGSVKSRARLGRVELQSTGP
jgi:hypothetical protein